MEKTDKKSSRDEQSLQVLEMTEFFDAPPEKVFQAWTNKKDFMAWYGPEDFTVPFCEMDVKVGGEWRACIKSPQGQEYWMQGKYLEIVAPLRLVFTYEDGSGKNELQTTVVTISLEKAGNKTRMDFRQTNFPNQELRDAHYGGWSSAFICLKQYSEQQFDQEK